MAEKMTIEVEIDAVPEGYIVLGTIALLKVLKADGEVVYREHFGGNDLTIMEKYGMTQSAADTMRERLVGPLRRDG